jgi:peptidoglycan/LPS O-acetylase OafA/YrhL
MADLGFHFTRRRALTSLLLLLLLAPIPLTQMSEMIADPQHTEHASGDATFWIVTAVVLMGSAVRGNRPALGVWAALSAVIGIAMLAWGFSAVHGSVRFLGGLIAIAASITFCLLRDELAEESREDPVQHPPRADTRTP